MISRLVALLPITTSRFPKPLPSKPLQIIATTISRVLFLHSPNKTAVVGSQAVVIPFYMDSVS